MAESRAAKSTTPAKKATAAKAEPAPPTPEEQAALDAAERDRLAAAQAEQEQARVEHEQQVRDDAAKGRSEVRREAETKEEREVASRVCVVSDGSPHTGYALPGKKICSAHEMHYLPDGTARVKAHAAEQKAAQKPDGGHLADEGK